MYFLKIEGVKEIISGWNNVIFIIYNKFIYLLLLFVNLINYDNNCNYKMIIIIIIK